MRRPRQRPSKRSLQTTDPAPHLDDLPEEDDLDRERGPQRRCIVTRDQGDRARMLRFVVGPDRSIVPDLGARLPGRGYWLSARANVLEGASPEAARRKGGLVSAFARAARGPVIIPADLAGMVRAGLVRRVVEHLVWRAGRGRRLPGSRRRASGSWQAAPGWWFKASDGSEEERRRLLSGALGVPVAWPLDAAALGSVFGRERSVHVAVASGRLAELVLIEIERLAGTSGTVLVKQAGQVARAKQAGE